VFVPVRERKPKLIYPLPKIITDRLNNKITSRTTFPKFLLEEDEETQFFIEELHKATDFRVIMKDAIKNLMTFGSAFVRVKIVNGVMGLACYNPNQCWPKFDDNGELESIEIRHIFEKKNKKNEIKKYWYRFTMDKQRDVLYDSPEYAPGEKPTFRKVAEVAHGLGFVQGEWVKFTKNEKLFEGPSVFREIMDFGDDLSYTYTLIGGAVQYGAEPQVLLKGMEDDEIDTLVKRKEKAWALGREGDAQYLESSGAGASAAESFEQTVGRLIQDISRVIMHDPEKFSAHAQSGKAMEILNGPMVELVEEYRPYCEKFFTRLTIKMLVSVVILTKRGMVTDFNIPGGYKPKTFDIQTEWPPVFPLSVQDKQEIVNFWTSLTTNNIVSRQTALEKMVSAKVIDEIDIQQEVNLVNTQKEFGGFF